MLNLIINVINFFCEKEYISAITIIIQNIIVFVITTRLIYLLLIKIWTFLSPYLTLIEFTLIIICINLFSLLVLIANNILQKLENSFQIKNNTLKENTKKIRELEEKLKKYT